MEQLGIDVQVILFQVANFFILLYILKRFLYKPVIDMLEKRKQTVIQNQQLKEDLDKKMDDIHKQQESLLAETREEARGIMDQAREQGEQIQESLRAEGKKQADQIVEKGQQEVEQLKDSIKREMREEVSTIAVNVTQKVLEEQLTPEQKTKITEDAIRRFTQKNG